MSQPMAVASSVSHAWTAASERCALDMRHDNHDLLSLDCLCQHLPMALALCVIHHKAAHKLAHDVAVHDDIMHAAAVDSQQATSSNLYCYRTIDAVGDHVSCRQVKLMMGVLVRM